MWPLYMETIMYRENKKKVKREKKKVLEGSD